MNLTTDIAFANGKRLIVVAANRNDDETEFVVTIQLRSPAASDLIYATAVVVLRDGPLLTDRIRSGVPIPVGSQPSAALVREIGALTLATAHTDGWTIWKGGGSKNSRSDALLADGLAKGWVHSSLVGT